MEHMIVPIIVALVIGLIAAWIKVSNVKSKYRPVQLKKNAANYLVGGSFRLTGTYENFLRKDVTQKAIENQNGTGNRS